MYTLKCNCKRDEEKERSIFLLLSFCVNLLSVIVTQELRSFSTPLLPKHENSIVAHITKPNNLKDLIIEKYKRPAKANSGDQTLGNTIGAWERSVLN